MAAPLSCDQCEELLVDYLLHALETEAVGAVTEHLSTCDRCRAQLAAYEAVLGQLAQAVPQQEPPLELRSRLLAEAVEGSMLTASAPEPLHPPRRPTLRPRWAFLLTAANVVLCLGVGWWTWHVQREAALVHQRWQDVQRYLALQRQAFTLITAPEVRPVVLRSPKAESQARGVLLLKPEEPHAVLIVQDLPPLAQDRAYQLWLGFGDRQRDDGGVFRVDEQGFGVIPVTAPRPFTAYQRVGITEEPAGGSPGPTSPRVISATLEGF
jgi:anti-sigma-K factor RskA